MTRLTSLLCLTVAVVLVGCVHNLAHSGMRYRAVVESVEMPEGVYFTTNEGSAPMVFLVLRVSEEAVKRDERLLRVHVLDRFDPEIYGEPGDVVSFRYQGPLPDTNAVTFDDLKDYRVVAKASGSK